jgi:cytoskeletal protein CcmA (bactofilin family)
MFQKNNKEKNKMQDMGHVPAINMISDGTRINGTLVTKKDFRISGELEGSLSVEGKCIVSATAVIKGDIVVTEADIAGRVEGEIVVKNRLVLRQTAVVIGDVHTRSLLVEEGAVFEGACHMSKNPGQQELKTNQNGVATKSENRPLKLNKAANE